MSYFVFAYSALNLRNITKIMLESSDLDRSSSPLIRPRYELEINVMVS